MIRRAFVLMTTVAACTSAGFAADKLMMSGKVTNQQHRPVAHVQVLLVDSKQRVIASDGTDKLGRFELMHAALQGSTLKVIPPPKSGLAQAVLHDVPNEEGGHMVVTLRHGFPVTGRVVYDGKPAKGLAVYVTSSDEDAAHNFNETTTDGKGLFSVVVTPGAKKLIISNYSEQETLSREFAVSGDTVLDDTQLPNNWKVGAR